MKPILVVEDEAAIADLIAMTLRSAGYDCHIAADGLAAADKMQEADYALALLDIMLPEVDGYDLLNYALGLELPVIFITAKGTLQDRVNGLRLGADDYIVKPFEPAELVARVESVLRRTKGGQGVYRAWDVVLDTHAHTVVQQGKMVPLAPREFELLAELLRRPGVMLGRDELYQAVWGQDADVDSRTLDLHINRLRKKLGWQTQISTSYKVGYRLEVEPR